jgi:hypothetical protein
MAQAANIEVYISYFIHAYVPLRPDLAHIWRELGTSALLAPDRPNESSYQSHTTQKASYMLHAEG